MNACGLWQGTRRLAAVIANEDGSLQPPLTSPATPDHARLLLDYLVTAGIDTLILAERSHVLITLASARNLNVRLVPNDLFSAILHATALNHRPPGHTASLLARWPSTPALRPLLRELRPAAPQKNQLPLF
jgi:hypothetical protein